MGKKGGAKQDKGQSKALQKKREQVRPAPPPPRTLVPRPRPRRPALPSAFGGERGAGGPAATGPGRGLLPGSPNAPTTTPSLPAPPRRGGWGGG